jgi:hypothetical protein
VAVSIVSAAGAFAWLITTSGFPAKLPAVTLVPLRLVW